LHAVVENVFVFSWRPNSSPEVSRMLHVGNHVGQTLLTLVTFATGKDPSDQVIEPGDIKDT
jgi:hypothetical protein